MGYELIVGTQNVLHSNSPAEQAMDLRQLFAKTNLGFGQECYGFGFREGLRATRDHNLGMYRPTGWASSEPIFWDRDVLRGIRLLRGKYKCHDGVADLTPARGLVWRMLLHLDSGAEILAINKHPINGYAKNKPPAAKRRRLAKEDWRETDKEVDYLFDKLKPDFGILAGDLNARLDNLDRWFYPGNILKEDWQTGRGFPNGIDQVLVSRKGPARTTDRKTFAAKSDHKLRIAVVEW